MRFSACWSEYPSWVRIRIVWARLFFLVIFSHYKHTAFAFTFYMYVNKVINRVVNRGVFLSCNQCFRPDYWKALVWYLVSGPPLFCLSRGICIDFGAYLPRWRGTRQQGGICLSFCLFGLYNGGFGRNSIGMRGWVELLWGYEKSRSSKDRVYGSPWAAVVSDR